MFPSNPNVPHDLPSSTDHIFPLDSFSNHGKYDVPFNYLQMNDHPYEFLFHTYNNTAAGPPPPIMQNSVTTINQDFVRQQQKFSERSGLQYCEDSHNGLLDSVVSSYKKKIATSKKDGRRKINTARGPKDRRVRFSTEIARKFFGLQDFLGFERASKTLDWLLTNSVTAIKELVEESNHDSSDQSNQKFLEAIINGGSDGSINGGKNKSVVKHVEGKKKKTKRKREFASLRGNNVARDQSRAEARASARERTREKMRVKKLDLDSKLTLMKSGDSWSEIESEK